MRIHAENEFAFCNFDCAIFRGTYPGDIGVFFVPYGVTAAIAAEFFESNVAEIINDYDFTVGKIVMQAQRLNGSPYLCKVGVTW
jgi:uncharacterized protein YutD